MSIFADDKKRTVGDDDDDNGEEKADIEPGEEHKASKGGEPTSDDVEVL